MDEKAPQSILVIDDEQLMVEMYSTILQGNGYIVTHAYSGQQGIEVFSQNPQKFDLVLLDFLFPDLNGEKVFERLREIKPTVKIILMSGLDGSRKVDNLLKAGAISFIEKPCRSQKLVDSVFEALNTNAER